MPQVRVLIVDDSVVIRRLLSDTLAAEPQIEVAAVAATGEIALGKLDTVHVDVVVLDVDMPGMGGIEALRQIRKRDRRLPVIMFSTLTERGARATMEALAAGASDYVAKPANMGSITESRDAIRTQLIPRVLTLGGIHPAPTHVSSAPVPRTTRAARLHVRPKVLVIGSSTGGPEALNRLIPRLPADLPVPVLIVQHMPPLFTKMLAERLDRTSPLSVREATEFETLEPGVVYIAPGGAHLEMVAGTARSPLSSRLTAAPPEHFCRPSVDVLFRSAAAVCGAAVLGVVLTGMGSDGCAGSEQIDAAGGRVIVQNQATSVVWGMPGTIATKGLADEILPLDLMAAAIIRRLSGVHVSSADSFLLGTRPVTATP